MASQNGLSPDQKDHRALRLKLAGTLCPAELSTHVNRASTSLPGLLRSQALDRRHGTTRPCTTTSRLCGRRIGSPKRGGRAGTQGSGASLKRGREVKLPYKPKFWRQYGSTWCADASGPSLCPGHGLCPRQHAGSTPLILTPTILALPF